MFSLALSLKLGLNKRNHENTAQHTVHRRGAKRLSNMCVYVFAPVNFKRHTAYMTMIIFVQYNHRTCLIINVPIDRIIWPTCTLLTTPSLSSSNLKGRKYLSINDDILALLCYFFKIKCFYNAMQLFSVLCMLH
jgi:hypothetical protein